MLKHIHIAMALTAASLGSMACAAPQPAVLAADGESGVAPVRRRRRLALTPGAKRRSRGPQAKPKRRTNMVRHGQRIRRRHRRAA